MLRCGFPPTVSFGRFNCGECFLCPLFWSVFSVSSLVWTYVVFIEFSRRWFRMKLLIMAVLVLETVCYGLCLTSLESRVMQTCHGFFGVDARLWHEAVDFLTVGWLSLGTGPVQGWAVGRDFGRAAEGAALPACAHILVWLFSLSLASREC